MSRQELDRPGYLLSSTGPISVKVALVTAHRLIWAERRHGSRLVSSPAEGNDTRAPDIGRPDPRGATREPGPSGRRRERCPPTLAPLLSPPEAARPTRPPSCSCSARPCLSSSPCV